MQHFQRLVWRIHCIAPFSEMIEEAVPCANSCLLREQIETPLVTYLCIKVSTKCIGLCKPILNALNSKSTSYTNLANNLLHTHVYTHKHKFA